MALVSNALKADAAIIAPVLVFVLTGMGFLSFASFESLVAGRVGGRFARRYDSLVGRC
jgi:hypothetical protein